jgi:hypothetical protein
MNVNIPKNHGICAMSSEIETDECFNFNTLSRQNFHS